MKNDKLFSVYGPLEELTPEKVYQRELELEQKRDYAFFTRGKGRRWEFEDGNTTFIDGFSDCGRGARDIRRGPDESAETVMAREAKLDALEEIQAKQLQEFKDYLLEQDRIEPRRFSRERLFTVLDLIVTYKTNRKESISCLLEKMLYASSIRLRGKHTKITRKNSSKKQKNTRLK